MSNKPEYPKRPRFFAYKFTRLLGKVCIGSEIGPDACWLLSYIAHTEDAAGYRRPVTFFNEDLATRLGMSITAMRRARDRAVKAGWLTYIAGAKRRAPCYFVTVPLWASGHDDGAGDEQPSELVVATAVDIPRQFDAESGEQAAGKRRASGQPSSLALALTQDTHNPPAEPGGGVCEEEDWPKTAVGPKPAEVVAHWNSFRGLVQCAACDANRDRYIRTWATSNPRWIAHWRDTITFMGNESFYCGGGARRWKATLSWLFKDSNFVTASERMLEQKRILPQLSTPVIRRSSDVPGVNAPTADPWPVSQPQAPGDKAA